jgi:hypothetical protein
MIAVVLLIVAVICAAVIYFAVGFFPRGGNGQSILLVSVAGALFTATLIFYQHLLSVGAPHPARTTFIFLSVGLAMLFLSGWLGFRSNRPRR